MIYFRRARLKGGSYLYHFLPCERNAIDFITARAEERQGRERECIKRLLDHSSLCDIDMDTLLDNIFAGCSVTINFHPDRVSNNGKMVIENLLNDGEYLNQFVTGTTNGGRTAFKDGERDLWEKSLFNGAYHRDPSSCKNRPKYGALNILHYLDGAAPRFGSCFLVLKDHVADRCTFAFGDSSTNPDSLGTRQVFYPVLKAMLDEIQNTGTILNQAGYTLDAAIAYFGKPRKGRLSRLGRELDHCIEAHVHGNVDLRYDVCSLYVDESYKNSDIYKLILKLSNKYKINLHWIPMRKLHVNDITGEFRGPMIKPLAVKISSEYPSSRNIMNAALIGRASRDIALNPHKWLEIGNEQELFQYIKQLWHTIARFG